MSYDWIVKYSLLTEITWDQLRIRQWLLNLDSVLIKLIIVEVTFLNCWLQVKVKWANILINKYILLEKLAFHNTCNKEK